MSAAAASGIDATPTGNPSVQSQDPFAEQRNGSTDLDKVSGSDDMRLSSSPPDKAANGRRMSKEWDASKVPPSQFQRRKGSIYSTPSSRDSHTDGKRDQAYFDKLKEKGWSKVTGGTK